MELDKHNDSIGHIRHKVGDQDTPGDLVHHPVFYGYHTTTTGLDPMEGVNREIRDACNALEDLLQYKNRKYGNSALSPIKVFSKSDTETGLLQRMDDKIARIQNSPELRKNDVADLFGYLALLCVAKGWTNFDEFKD